MSATAPELISAIGLAHTDDRVKEILDELGHSKSKIKLERGEFDCGIEAPDFGVDILLSDPSTYRLDDSFPDGGLVLSAVFFFSEGCEDHGQFRHPLPRGLKFGMKRPQVRQLLGEPEWTSAYMPVDRWNIDGLRMSVDYSSGEEEITRVSVALPDK